LNQVFARIRIEFDSSTPAVLVTEDSVVEIRVTVTVLIVQFRTVNV
jgi:hypothetical protein